jgi:hypothetical protein
VFRRRPFGQTHGFVARDMTAALVPEGTNINPSYTRVTDSPLPAALMIVPLIDHFVTGVVKR